MGAVASAGVAALGGCASTTPIASTSPGAESLIGTQWEGWQERRFPGKKPTRYELLPDGLSGYAIRATAQGSASMFQRKLDIAPERLGHVRFSWRADDISEEADIAEIDATDAVTRIVFAFDGDRSRWSAKDTMLNEISRLLMGEDMPYASLVYAWCSTGVTGSVVINPRTPTVRNLLLETGDSRLGVWLNYRRNLRRDYLQLFGEEPGRLIGVALMTDADNTKSESVGWYGNVRIEGA
ncbi:MAG: hypothetical protein RLZZ271_440 [Pseudomonadota bacterium]|jgi:hypothetical protein